MLRSFAYSNNFWLQFIGMSPDFFTVVVIHKRRGSENKDPCSKPITARFCERLPRFDQLLRRKISLFIAKFWFRLHQGFLYQKVCKFEFFGASSIILAWVSKFFKKFWSCCEKLCETMKKEFNRKLKVGKTFDVRSNRNITFRLLHLCG